MSTITASPRWTRLIAVTTIAVTSAVLSTRSRP